MPVHNKACFLSHMGPWMMHHDHMANGLSAFREGLLEPLSYEEEVTPMMAGNEFVHAGYGAFYEVSSEGIAYVSLSGALMKGRSKYGGTSTVDARSSIRHAAANQDVESTLIIADSPGGHSAGTQELGDEISRAAKIKPVHAHVDDLAASATLWAISQATTISASRSSFVGSIGTYTVVYDSSEKMEKDGIKATLITTGDYKGAGVPGVPVSEEQIADVQRVVNQINSHFLQAVADGRNMTVDQVKEMATGQIWVAEEAKQMGLIDRVQNLDDTIAMVQSEIEDKRNKRNKMRDDRRSRLSQL